MEQQQIDPRAPQSYGWIHSSLSNVDPETPLDLELWMRVRLVRFEAQMDEHVANIEAARAMARSVSVEDISERRVTWHVVTKGTGHGCQPQTRETLPPPGRKGWQ